MPQLHRYYLPSTNGEGWADIVVSSDGFFAAVSDYGNYAYRWWHFGVGDFREWLLTVGADYFLGKISTRDELDVERAEKQAKAILVEERRRRQIPKRVARKAWVEIAGVNDEHSLIAWYEEFDLDHVLMQNCIHFPRCYPLAARSFAEKTLPRLKRRLQAELACPTPARLISNLTYTSHEVEGDPPPCDAPVVIVGTQNVSMLEDDDATKT